MKNFAFLAILFFSISNTTIAQSKQEDLKNLFELMQTNKMVDQMMDQMLPILTQQTEQLFKDDADKVKKTEEFFAFVKEETKVMTKNFIDEDMVGVYDKHFTHDEVKELAAFYATPLGKKLLEKTPVISGETMQIMMQKHMPAFQAKVGEKLKELMAKK